MAEASSVDEAGDKFRDLIDDHADDESFEHVTDGFVESIVEVRKRPERGALAQMQIIEPGVREMGKGSRSCRPR